MKFNKCLIVGGILLCLILATSCAKEETVIQPVVPEEPSAITQTFGDKIDANNLFDYAGLPIPDYINRDNTGNNTITNAGATLGRVLFYDKKLSANDKVACASCHKQELAFGDDLIASEGVNGTTGRHSMRLVNARFSDEERFFWDERANTLEEQASQPIQDHIEMGFSGENGDPGLADLLAKLDAVDYYQELFALAYGDASITESRIQDALAQFIRSIQSFDSKYDIGRNEIRNDNVAFPNFTAQENMGKQLFTAPPQFDGNGFRVGGGLGCAGCHRPPEFSIDPTSMNNGIISSFAGTPDFDVTRAPSLRDVVNAQGQPNGPFMHTGELADLVAVLEHYNDIDDTDNPRLDFKLRPLGEPQKLQLTDAEKDAVVAFLQTLTGTEIYTAAQWSNPFE